LASGYDGSGSQSGVDCTGDITCQDAFPGYENSSIVGCDNACYPAGTQPEWDCTENCTTTPCDPNEIVEGNEDQPAECEECGCSTVVDNCCTGSECDGDGPIHFVGSEVFGGYCDCLCKVVDICGNCGGSCEDVNNDGFVTCGDGAYDGNGADCNGDCCGDAPCVYLVNNCSECVENGASGTIIY
jgi:hypothetical protein